MEILMRRHVTQTQIRPKVSTMPRSQTEAAAYLEIYKLVNEKKRLQQELELLEQRRERIQKRLEVLNVQVLELEQDAHQLRDAAPSQPKLSTPIETANPKSFNMLFLEY